MNSQSPKQENIWLMKKDNWLNYPKLMLRYRAIWQVWNSFVLKYYDQFECMKRWKTFWRWSQNKKKFIFERIDNVDDILEWFETNVRSSDLLMKKVQLLNDKEVVLWSYYTRCYWRWSYYTRRSWRTKKKKHLKKEEKRSYQIKRKSWVVEKVRKHKNSKKEAAEGEEPKSNVIEVWSRYQTNLCENMCQRYVLNSITLWSWWMTRYDLRKSILT